MALQSKSYLIFIYFVLSVLLILLDANNMLSFTHSLSQSIFTPIRISFKNASISLSNTFSISSKDAYIEELDSLRIQNANLLSEASRAKSIEEENVEMRRLLDANLPSSWNFSPSSVVSVLEDSLFVTHVPDITNNTPVIYAQEGGRSGVYIGKTEELVGGEIRVMLATHTESKIAVLVRDAKTRDRRASGILFGRGGKMVLDQVLSSETVNPGDLVVTSGDAGMPQELLVGTIGEIIESDNTAVKSAFVEGAVDFRKLKEVFLITKY